MRKYIYKLLWVCLIPIVGLSVSCKDYLDKAPESIVSGDDAFINFTNFQGFVEELYSCVPDFTKVNWTCCWNFADESFWGTDLHHHVGPNFDNGNYWNWQHHLNGWGVSWLDEARANTQPDDSFPKGLWPLSWYGIRKANLGLESLDKLKDATSEEKKFVEGQLLFFRGYFHFQLMTFWGGLPYIDEVMSFEDNKELPRLSYQETAELVAKDLLAAAELLPANWDNTVVGKRTYGKNQQRITKTMAYGFLGKNYLFAASPLMNEESTGSVTYDAELCKKAADAFTKVFGLIDSGASFHKMVDFEEYSSVFYTQNQGMKIPGYPEAIFAAPAYSAWHTRWGIAPQFGAPELGGDGYCPTANYVENYGMANGLPIDDPESGFDINDPFANRDPRFYHDIMVDGDRMIQGAAPPDKEKYRYASLYTGGSTRNERNGSRSGYLLRKFVPKDNNDVDNGWDRQLHLHLAYMRVPDIYLMYAEAMLHGYGSATVSHKDYRLSAEDAVNVVRRRAGAGDVHSKYLSSKDAFMEEIIRERAVELGWEGHRFHDIRRWKVAGDKKYIEKTAHDFDRGPDGKPVNFTTRVVKVRVFTNKHYWLPLKIDDVNLYPTFGQNPGW